MFASSQSGAFICYRCQSRALRRLLPSLNRNLHYSPLSLSSSRRQFSHLRTVQSERYIYPHGKLRGRKGGEVRESSEVLPVTALGKSAEIILLKDADIDRIEEDKVPDNPEDETQAKHSPSKGAILWSLEDGGSPVDPSSVNSLIDELRDAAIRKSIYNGQTLYEEDFEQLIQSLTGGFTKGQLSAYIKHAMDQKARDSQLVQDENESKRIRVKIPHTIWTAGISSTKKRRQFDRGRGTGKMSKREVAKEVITECWELNAEDSTIIGEIDVSLPHSLLKSRNEFGQSMLDQIAERRRVKIQTISKHMIRITGDKASVTDALKDLQKMRSSAISVQQYILPSNRAKKLADEHLTAGRWDKPCLSLASRYFVDEQDIKEMSELTGVQILRKKGTTGMTYLQISGQSQEQVEDGQRALFAISELRTRSVNIFIGQGSPQAPSFQQFPPSEAGLSYRESKETWFHKSGIVTRDSASLSNPHTTLAKLKKLAKKLEEHITPQSKSSQSRVELPDKNWSMPETSVSTRVGQIYHGANESIFTPCLPYLPAVLLYLSAASPSMVSSPTRNVISFNFRHDPNKDTDLSTIAPNTLPEIKFEFELTTAASGEKTTALTRLFAITNDDNLNIALPNRPVDLSVNVTTSRTFKINEDLDNSKISKAVKQITASILGSGRLRAPLTIHFPVPSSWTDQPSSVELEKSTIEKKYRFVGVEHKQIVSFEAEGRQASFTYVEGGKLGRSYSELKVLEDGKAGAKEILERGLRVVDVVDKAAKGILYANSSKEKEAKKRGVELAEAVEVEEQQVEQNNLNSGVLNAWGDLQAELENEQEVEEEEEEQRVAAAG